MELKQKSPLFKVKLVHCGNRNIRRPKDTIEKFTFLLPMGIFSLANIIDINGFDVEIIHLDLENENDISKIIKSEENLVVGFDLHWANQSVVVLDIVEELKLKNPNVFIFLGGYTATYYHKEILNEYTGADAVIKGDGELPLLELCKTIEKNIQKGLSFTSDLEDVQNISFRKEDGQITSNSISFTSVAKELDTYNFDRYDLLRNSEVYFNISKYWSKFKPFKDLSPYIVEIGRGCGYECVCCGGSKDTQVELSNRKGLSVRSEISVLDSIKRGIKLGYRLFFSCFEFIESDDYYISLFLKVKEENPTLSFVYESWRLPSKRLVDAMSSTFSNVLITISPDTGDDDIRLKQKDKNICFSNAELLELIQHVKVKKNVKLQLYFGYFLPGDTISSIQKTMKLILNLYNRYSDIVEILFMNFNTDPGSVLYKFPESFGMDIKVNSLKDFIHYQKMDYGYEGNEIGKTLLAHPTIMSEDKAVDLANKIVIFNYFLYFPKTLHWVINQLNIDEFINFYMEELIHEEELSTVQNVYKAFKTFITRKGHKSEEIEQIINQELSFIPVKSALSNISHRYRVIKQETENLEDLLIGSEYIESDSNIIKTDFDF